MKESRLALKLTSREHLPSAIALAKQDLIFGRRGGRNNPEIGIVSSNWILGTVWVESTFMIADAQQ